MKFNPTAFRALGRKPKGLGTDRMNATEREYAAMLDIRQRAGEIVLWRFEAIKIRMADNTFYTPDFLVLLADMRLQLHEVKGAFVMDDARVKLKVCAETFPSGVVLAQKVNKQWTIEELA